MTGAGEGADSRSPGAEPSLFDTAADLDVLVVSHDGAPRLDALLRSLQRNLRAPVRVHVVFRSGNTELERGYDALRAWFPEVRWTDDRSVFMRAVRELAEEIAAGPGRLLLPLGDHVALCAPVAEELLDRIAADRGLVSLALHLGGGGLSGRVRGPAMRWRWAEAPPGPAACPFSLAGQVARTADLLPLLRNLREGTPAGLAEALARERPEAHRHQALLCPAANCAARIGAPDLSARALHDVFASGLRLSFDPAIRSRERDGTTTIAARFEPDPRPRPRAPDPVKDPWRPQRIVAGHRARPNGEQEIDLPGGGTAVLNRTAFVVWDLCDGRRTVADMLQELGEAFDAPATRLRRDVQGVLQRLVDLGLIAPARAAALGAETRRLDLRQVPCFVITCEEDPDRKRELAARFQALGLQVELVPGIPVEPSWVGVALAHLRVLRLSRARVPFLVLEEDCVFTEAFDPVLEVPIEADAYSLGLSTFGLPTPGEFAWGNECRGKVQVEPYTSEHLRARNMLARHAVVYLTDEYRERVIESQVEALTHRSQPHMGDIGCAILHASSIVLAPQQVVCLQSNRRGATGNPLLASEADTTPTPDPPSAEPPSEQPSAPVESGPLRERPFEASEIDEALRAFQEANAQRDPCAVLHLGARGFFAEITTVARAMAWSFLRGYQLVLDSSQFSYAERLGWSDYFEPFCCDVSEVDPKRIVKRLRFEPARRSTPEFVEMRAFQPGRFSIAGRTYGNFQETLALLLSGVFRFDQRTQREVERLIAPLELPPETVTLHVRRGDKVGDEDIHYRVEDYLDRIAGGLERTRAVFVMSDSWEAVEETRRVLSMRGFAGPCRTLVDPSQSGFDVHKLRRGERFMAHEEGGEELSDAEYVRRETVRVLAEVTVAARSRAFVSTWRSNVGRTVWYLHPQPRHCRLLSPRDSSATRPEPETPPIGAVEGESTPAPPVSRPFPARPRDLSLRLEGGHGFRVVVDEGSTAWSQLTGDGARGGTTGRDLVQVPLDGGRAALTFPRSRLAGVDVATPAPPSPRPEDSGQTLSTHDLARQRLHCGEGHLGGYIRAVPGHPDLEHGDPMTWCPAVWRWAVDTFGGDSVLDVGCGEGHSTRFFRDLGCRVLGVDGSALAAETSRVPDRHVRHDFTRGPFVPDEEFDLVWSCEFVEHVESRFSHNFLATFAVARKAILMTFAEPGQSGWHHVHCRPREHWVDLVGRLGFRWDRELTEEARALQPSNHFHRSGLVFVRESPVPRPRRGGRIGRTLPPAGVDRQLDAPAAIDPLPTPDLEVHGFPVARENGLDFHLFLDVFVHPSREKVVAVAPHYDRDWNPRRHGVDHEQVDLVTGELRITARYLPHGLDSFEPCILLEWEGEALAERLRAQAEIELAIEVGPHRREYRLSTEPPPAHDVAMSLVVKNENRWIRHFLEHALSCLEADHVYVYDNGTEDREELLEILRPYRSAGQVTYIPWDVRWRNRDREPGNPKPRKMIGQPPQEAHSLSRFAHCGWIGFFDVDELLRVPGRTLPELLADFDRVPVDGLSFGLRWFLHLGEEPYEEIRDFPLTFLHARRDELGRKRQKLFVKPGEVRFARLHWLEDGRSELAVDDSEIFFHHYELRRHRLDASRERAARGEDADWPGGHRPEPDDFMLRFRDRLELDLPPRPGSVEEWIEWIDRAFGLAETLSSRVPPGVLEVEGMCGLKTRHFYNALCGFEGCRFLEVGGLYGASVTAAAARNRIRAVTVDNFSEWRPSKDKYLAHVERWRGLSEVRLVEADCFEIDAQRLGRFDVYLYDGHHGRDSQRKGLEHLAPALADLAVVIVDDWNWERVRLGTRDALSALPWRVHHRREIVLPEEDVRDMPRHAGSATWWNGICVLLVEPRPDVERGS